MSYAVTRNSRSAGNAGDETAELAASRLLQYGDLIHYTITQMQAIQGISTSRLDFQSPLRIRESGAAYPLTNGLCTTTKCQVFHAQGGGAPYIDFEDISTLPDGWNVNYEKPGHHTVHIIKVEDVGSELPEVVLRLINVNDEVCRSVNLMMGLEESPGYSLTGESFNVMRNGYDIEALLYDTGVWTFGDDDNDLAGAKAFCIPGTNNTFYYVLLER